MLEIEQKFARPDFDALQRELQRRGAVLVGDHDEADHYFNAPDRDFATTGEAFRLRRVGTDNFLTFKGPRRATTVKVRRELELPLLAGDEAAARHLEMLGLLGYRPVAVVRKHRRSFRLQHEGTAVVVCLDEVAEVGRFAEVEVLAPEAQAATAQAVLSAVAAGLGLTEVEPHSYLNLLLTSRAAGSHTNRPVLVRTVAELRQAMAGVRRQRGQTVGLVPTMGALHEGHRSLIVAARARNECVVVSIFVNPMQFGAHEDLARYPRPLSHDTALCAEAGVDLLFVPEAAEMVPPTSGTYVEVTPLQNVLEGAARPGHFRGVATVVLKLLNLVGPDRAYFGQKDAQQVRVVQTMVRDLNVPVEIVVAPTVRAPDGLALSSRNSYLDTDQRHQASVLSRAFFAVRDLAAAGERDGAVLRQALAAPILATPGAVLDYAAVVDAETFAPIEQLRGPALLLLAVKFGPTRLIDNLPIGADGR